MCEVNVIVIHNEVVTKIQMQSGRKDGTTGLLQIKRHKFQEIGYDGSGACMRTSEMMS